MTTRPVDVRADLLLWRIARARRPNLVLKSFDEHLAQVIPGCYYQLWISDEDDMPQSLLLVHESGSIYDGSIAPDFYRVASGQGLVGTAFALGRSSLHDMTAPEQLALAAAPKFVEQEQLRTIAVCPLRSNQGAFLLAVRDDATLPYGRMMSAVEDMASAVLNRYEELRDAQFNSRLKNIVDSLAESLEEVNVLDDFLGMCHRQFESSYSAVVRWIAPHSPVQVVLSSPGPPARPYISPTAFLRALSTAARPIRRFQLEESWQSFGSSVEGDDGLRDTMASLEPQLAENGHVLAYRIGPLQDGSGLSVILFRNILRPGFLPSDSRGLSRLCDTLGNVLEHRRRLAQQTAVLRHTRTVLAAPYLSDIIAFILRAVTDLYSALAVVIAIRESGPENRFDVSNSTGIPVDIDFGSAGVAAALASKQPSWSGGTSSLSKSPGSVNDSTIEILLPVVRLDSVVAVIYALVERSEWVRRNIDASNLLIYADHLALALSERAANDADAVNKRKILELCDGLSVIDTIRALRTLAEVHTIRAQRNLEQLRFVAANGTTAVADALDRIQSATAHELIQLRDASNTLATLSLSFPAEVLPRGSESTVGDIAVTSMRTVGARDGFAPPSIEMENWRQAGQILSEETALIFVRFIAGLAHFLGVRGCSDAAVRLESESATGGATILTATWTETDGPALSRETMLEMFRTISSQLDADCELVHIDGASMRLVARFALPES